MKYIKFTCLLLILIIAGCGQATDNNDAKTEINVSAAVSMSEGLADLKEAFEAEHSTIEVTFNFGGSGTLRKQIEQGAPVDLFFSASKDDYDALERDGMVEQGEAILENELVVISSDQVTFDSFDDFYQSDQEMAIGTPVAVPAGTYAKQALQKMDVWDKLQDRLILTKDVQQVLTYVDDGSVDVGMVYASDLNKADNVQVLETIDSDYHEPIEYFAALIQSDNDEKMEAAEMFYDYVQTESSMEVFEHYGFQMASGEND